MISIYLTQIQTFIFLRLTAMKTILFHSSAFEWVLARQKCFLFELCFCGKVFLWIEPHYRVLKLAKTVELVEDVSTTLLLGLWTGEEIGNK